MIRVPLGFLARAALCLLAVGVLLLAIGVVARPLAALAALVPTALAFLVLRPYLRVAQRSGVIMGLTSLRLGVALGRVKDPKTLEAPDQGYSVRSLPGGFLVDLRYPVGRVSKEDRERWLRQTLALEPSIVIDFGEPRGRLVAVSIQEETA